MAGTPIYKVYTADNEYIASVKSPIDGAILVGAHTHGTVRYGHSKTCIIWNEGNEDFSAGESWDLAADVMADRLAHPRFHGPDYIQPSHRSYFGLNS